MNETLSVLTVRIDAVKGLEIFLNYIFTCKPAMYDTEDLI